MFTSTRPSSQRYQVGTDTGWPSGRTETITLGFGLREQFLDVVGQRGLGHVVLSSGVVHGLGQECSMDPISHASGPHARRRTTRARATTAVSPSATTTRP